MSETIFVAIIALFGALLGSVIQAKLPGHKPTNGWLLPTSIGAIVGLTVGMILTSVVRGPMLLSQMVTTSMPSIPTQNPSSTSVTATGTQSSAKTTSANQTPKVAIDFEKPLVGLPLPTSVGSLTLSEEKAHSGSRSAEITYKLSPNTSNFIVFRTNVLLDDDTKSISAWVYGNGSRDFLKAFITDSRGIVWQFTFGRLQHTGWRQMSTDLNTARPWPDTIVSGGITTPELIPPLQLTGLIIDKDAIETSSEGTIYIDDIETLPTSQH